MLPYLIKPKSCSYAGRIKGLFGSDLLAHWPMSEASGSIGYDVSGNGRNGTYSNITLGQPGIGDGLTAASFNGTNSQLNVYSASLNSVFPGDEGSFIIWSKMSASVWADGVCRVWWFFLDTATATYAYHFRKETDNNRGFRIYEASGTTIYLYTYAPEGFVCYGFSWSKAGNYKKGYLNGILNRSGTCAPDWSGKNLSATYSTIGGGYWHSGILAHAMIFNRPLTAAEHLAAHDCVVPAKKFTILADSISLPDSSWVPRVRDACNSSQVQVTDYGISGAHVMSDYSENLTKQVGQAELDDADVIIIELGTNDNNAGDMNALQAMIETNLDALAISNPRATIYYMNVLPRTTGDKGNIRTAIAAACTAKGVTCWDTYSTPWIDPATETSDGIHPTAAGYVKIATEVLARLP